MSWKVIERGVWRPGVPLEESQVAILRDGSLVFRVELLKSVGIGEFATLMADPDTLRIGLRAPKEHEIPRAVRVTVVRGHENKDTGRRSVRGARAFHALCLDPKVCAGRMELAIKEKLLLLNLVNVEMSKGDDAK
jgi:hypothetical protein